MVLALLTQGLRCVELTQDLQVNQEVDLDLGNNNENGVNIEVDVDVASAVDIVDLGDLDALARDRDGGVNDGLGDGLARLGGLGRGVAGDAVDIGVAEEGGGKGRANREGGESSAEELHCDGWVGGGVV